MTPGPGPIVVDTNILFSALLRSDTRFVDVLFDPDRQFFICETTLTELFRLKEKLVRQTTMDGAALTRAYHLVLKQVHLYKESWISSAASAQARNLCAGIDPDDEPQVALTLALDGVLWTGDRRLRDGVAPKGIRPVLRPVIVLVFQ